MYYGFILNMWIMRKIDEDFLKDVYEKGMINKREYDMILSTPRIPEL